VRIEAHVPLCADAAPAARKKRPAEEIRPDLEPVEAPLIGLGADADQRRRVGEEGSWIGSGMA